MAYAYYDQVLWVWVWVCASVLHRYLHIIVNGYFTTSFPQSSVFFRMSSDHPGWVFYKAFANSEEQGICLLQEDAPPIQRPPVVKPPGLDLKRQTYLYQNI